MHVGRMSVPGEGVLSCFSDEEVQMRPNCVRPKKKPT